jgi:molybdopterin converting factor subunit 1
MIVDIRFFARARDLAGTSELKITMPDGARVSDIRRILAEQFPHLAPLLPHLLVAVNENYAADESVIPPDATIACFPPVSGG